MELVPLFFGVIIMLVGVAVFRRVTRAKCRKALLKQRFSESERADIIRDFPLYARLPESLRDELDGLSRVFMAEKNFEACGGLPEVTPHMMRVVSTQACLLLLNRKHDFYRKLRSILIYPSAYTAKNEHGGEDVRLGESWNSGSVILAWDSVVSGGRDSKDGHHVTLHEFAHQLDQVDGAADGVPELACHGTGCYREWAAAFRPAFLKFQSKLDQGRRTVIDPYGASNPAEFFAVLTETFYEKPAQLHKHYPEVYEQLRGYYQVNPLEWDK
jgi:Mlc titration factor MtfA (ptsG expression regulator)